MGMVEGRERTVLALGLFPFQIHPFLFLCQFLTAQARAIWAVEGEQ